MTLKAVVRGSRFAVRAVAGTALAIAAVATLATPNASAAIRNARPHFAASGRFHVTGIVSGVKADSVKLFVESGVVAGRSASHQLLTVHLGRARVHEAAARRGHFRRSEGSFSVGELAHLSGRVFAQGSSDDLWAQSATVSQTAVITLVGTVYETGGSLVIVDRSVYGRCDQVNSFVDPVVVDDSSATVTLDGAAATASQIVAGQTVVVIGTNAENTILASAIYAFSTPPTIETGTLLDVSGTELAVTTFRGGYGAYWSSQGSDDNGSQLPGPFLVDASSATIVLNGVSGSTVADLTPGDAIIAVGPAGASTPLMAAVVFASSQSDASPVAFFSQHRHHWGFQAGQGWSGQLSGNGGNGGNGQGQSD